VSLCLCVPFHFSQTNFVLLYRAMIWDEFLRHFASVMRKIAGYLTKYRSEKDKKIAQSTHKNGYIKPRKTFWRNSKQLLNVLLSEKCASANEEYYKKVPKKFAQVKKSTYICTAFERKRFSITYSEKDWKFG